MIFVFLCQIDFIYDICLSLSDWLHLVWWSLVTSILLQMALFHFYGWVVFHCIYVNKIVQPLGHVWLFATLWTAGCQASVSFTIFWSMLKLMESVMLSNISSPVAPFSSCLQSFPASIKAFSNELALCIMWPKYWSFSISPSNECSGLISFRIDWVDLPAVQGILKSLLQHHSSKASIFGAQPSLWSTLTSTHDNWKNHSFD